MIRGNTATGVKNPILILAFDDGGRIVHTHFTVAQHRGRPRDGVGLSLRLAGFCQEQNPGRQQECRRLAV